MLYTDNRRSLILDFVKHFYEVLIPSLLILEKHHKQYTYPYDEEEVNL